MALEISHAALPDVNIVFPPQRHLRVKGLIVAVVRHCAAQPLSRCFLCGKKRRENGRGRRRRKGDINRREEARTGGERGEGEREKMSEQKREKGEDRQVSGLETLPYVLREDSEERDSERSGDE